MWEKVPVLEASIRAVTATAAPALKPDGGRQLPQAIDVEVTLIAVLLDMPAFSNAHITPCAASPHVGFNQHQRAGEFTHPFGPSTDSQSTSSPSLRRS